jgi:hypothetical protein
LSGRLKRAAGRDDAAPSASREERDSIRFEISSESDGQVKVKVSRLEQDESDARDRSLSEEEIGSTSYSSILRVAGS